MDAPYQELLEKISELSTLRAGMRFQDKYFTDPVEFGAARLPAAGGVYAILVPDPDWQPRPFRPVYFGTAENLAAQLTDAHEKLSEWRQASNRDGTLYLAYHLVSSDDAGPGLAEKLLQEYRLQPLPGR